MFARLMPREGKYFELFNAHAQQIVLGAKELVALMEVGIQVLTAVLEVVAVGITRKAQE